MDSRTFKTFPRYPTFYTALNRFDEEGIEGLIDNPPGPKEPSKAKDEVVERIMALRTENKSVYDIQTISKRNVLICLREMLNAC